MNQNLWPTQSWNGSVTAEEFAAQQNSSCSKGSCTCNTCNTRNPCPGQTTPMICCCQPMPTPPCPTPVQVEEGCCCKQSFRAALQLLCNSQLATLLDFNQAAFVTDTYVAGATINTTPAGTTPSDNLNTMSGSFRRFSPCNCDLLEISAAAEDAASAERQGRVKAMTKQEKAAEIARLEKAMKEAAKMLEFELAASLRDQIIELRGK